ncbi:hypothetical protein E4U17_006860 [Claviceps sp. LM77 group G4]|nr:hypothetical protein E4U17_006860 [Claviceps sp. LM77 group G4]KAG6065357.1 hypothetical protein E4U33_005918 [Claviceps sp. LM78 group G4]KAG6071679.1 hypothetical protein E4U16_005956 [Claviceps sp. LM84 group G4]
MGTAIFLALKNLLCTIRSLQLLCATLILAIFSYLLVALHEYSFQIDVDVRAVEGISGAAVLYTLINMLSQCCLASGLGCMWPLAVVLDVGFTAGFIFVAVVNKNGAGACHGYTDSPFGRGRGRGQGQLGNEASRPNMDGIISHVHPHSACELQRASFFTSIIAICLFVLSLLAEFVLVWHRRSPNMKVHANKSDEVSAHGGRSRSRSPDQAWQANSHRQGIVREATDIDDYCQSQDLEDADHGTGTISAPRLVRTGSQNASGLSPSAIDYDDKAKPLEQARIEPK